MSFNFKLSHKALILVGIPLIFELLFVVLLSWLLWQAEKERELETRTREVIAHAGNTQLLLVSTVASLLDHVGFQQSLPPEEFEAHLQDLRDKLHEEFLALSQLVKGDSPEAQTIKKLSDKTQEGLIKFKEVNQLFEDKQTFRAFKGLTELRDILHEAQECEAEAVEKLRPITARGPKTQKDQRELIQYLLAFAVLLNVLIAVGLAYYFNRGTTRRLAVLMDNTTRLAKHQELIPQVPGSDEIAHLDRVFHEMASGLAAAEKAKQEYVAMISHDLRSPLTSIQFILTMISDGTYGALSEAGVARTKAAESSAERLISLINTLLDLEKMEAGKLDMKLSEASTASIFERSLEAISSLADEAQITVEKPQSDFKILADADRLVQVLVNLLSNAIKFSPRGSVVTIAVQEIADSIKICVIDRGRGIPASHIQSVFDRFKQVEESDARERGGTGLGLAICKAIVEGHNGSIGIESELGKGSTFWFTVPVLKTAAVSVKPESH